MHLRDQLIKNSQSVFMMRLIMKLTSTRMVQIGSVPVLYANAARHA